MDLSKPVVLWITAAPLALQLSVWAVARETWFYRRIIESESGIVELATAFLLVPAVVFAISALRRARVRGLRLLPVLMIFYALGCSFLMGEELSWGQHWFGWKSPDYFLEYNKQDETNLHNLQSFNKNVLKWVVVALIGIGGIASLFRNKAEQMDGFWSTENSMIWVIPTPVCLWVAMVVLPLHVSTKVLGWNGIESYAAWGISLRETTELYVSIFFFLYAWSLNKRLVNAPSVASSS